MALKTKTLTASEARNLQKLHNAMADKMAGDASEASLKLVAQTLLTSVIPKFIGPAATAVNVLVKISEIQNTSANRSYLRGAAKGFAKIAERLERGGYKAMQVQQNWIKYTNISTSHEFVQGNDDNPEKAFVVKRLQTKSGTWVTPTN